MILEILKKITDVQQEKYGKSRSGSFRGWTIKKTAKLLSDNTTSISDHLKVSSAFNKYPELKKCKTLNEANRRLREYDETGILRKYYRRFDSENDLHKYLENEWTNTPLGYDWELKGSFYNAGTAGQIDILARHKKEPKLLVIELKKDQSPDKTIGQILRYIGWVKENLTKNGEEVLGLIISGFPPDSNFRYALSSIQKIKLKVYYVENEKVIFIEDKTLESLLYIKSLSPAELEEILRNQVSDK